MAPVEIRELSKSFGDVAAVRTLLRRRGRRVTGFLAPTAPARAPRCARCSGSCAHRRAPPPSTASPTTSSSGPRRASARCSKTPRSTRSQARNHLRVLAATGELPASRVDEVLVRRRARRRRRPAREGLLDGHAPAPGDRRRAARRPTGADPRRAHQRPGPTGDQLDSPADARPGRRWPRRAGLQPRPRRGRAIRRRRRRDRRRRPARPGTLQQVLGGDDEPAAEVRAQDPIRLTSALKARGYPVQGDGDVLLVLGATAQQVGEIAAEERVAVLGLAPRARSLEEAFFALTGAPA